jgi:hypothetical protein
MPLVLDALGTIFASLRTLAVVGGIFPPSSCHGEQMGEVVQFIPRKPDPDQKARLIREARAIYESIFPTEDTGTAPIDDEAS